MSAQQPQTVALRMTARWACSISWNELGLPGVLEVLERLKGGPTFRHINVGSNQFVPTDKETFKQIQPYVDVPTMRLRFV